MPLFLSAPSVVVAVIALLPIAYLLVRTAEAGASRVAEILLRERTLLLIGRSVLLATLVTSLSIAIGVGLAFLATRTDLPGRRLVAAVAPLPLAIPSYVAAFAWISAVPEVAGLRRLGPRAHALLLPLRLPSRARGTAARRPRASGRSPGAWDAPLPRCSVR